MNKELLKNISSFDNLLQFIFALFFVLLPFIKDISLILTISTLSGLFFLYSSINQNRILFPNSVLFALVSFFLFFLWALASNITNAASGTSYGILCLWLLGITAGFCYGYLTNTTKKNFGIFFVFGLLASISVALILSYLGLIKHDIFLVDRFQGASMHPSRLALFCATAGIYACNAYFYATPKTHKFFWASITVILGFIIYFSATRTIMLVYPVAIIGVIIINNYKKLWLIVAVSLLITGIAGILLVSNKDSYHAKRIISAVSNIKNDSTFLTRLPIWEAGFAAFKDSPVLGKGVHGYSKFHLQYKDSNKENWDKKYVFYESSVKQAHNLLLGRLVDSGLPGALLFFSFYLISCYLIFRSPAKEIRWISIFLLFYLAIGAFDDMLYRRNDAFIFVLIGIGLGAYTQLSTSKQAYKNTISS